MLTDILWCQKGNDQKGRWYLLIERKSVWLGLSLIVVIIAGVIYGVYSFRAHEITQEQVRDATMTYVRINHPETAQCMKSLSWTGGNITPKGVVGGATYSCTSDGWNVTMQYPVVPNALYSITANYVAPSAHVACQGTWQNGTITETSYSNSAR
jgi:hypothetical protein